MVRLRDIAEVEITPGARVMLLREIEMERLFAGYAAALQGAPVPRDLIGGSEGLVLSIEEGDEPMGLVEFSYDGKAFWRGALKGEEMARCDGGG